MTRADIIQEIHEIDEELNKHREHRAPLQLRAFRRRRTRLHKMLNEQVQRHMKDSSSQQLALL